MTIAVFDFKSIAKKLNRQEQKAEYEAKNPEPSMYGWPYGVAVPFVGVQTGGTSSQYLIGRVGDSGSKTLNIADLPPYTPYTGTAHEWPKVKI